MPKSRRPDAAEGCLVITKSVLKIYGNKQLFSWLANWMQHLEKSSEGEYRELHLEPQDEFKKNKKTGNPEAVLDEGLFALCEESLSEQIEFADSGRSGFHINFVVVDDEDIEKMRRYLPERIVPDNWVDGDEDQEK